jgi:hypothetical protein
MIKRTYKLELPYPSLPHSWKKGTIVNLTKDGLSYEPDFMNPVYRALNRSEVENNPVFWSINSEEWDYEILSFISRPSGNVVLVESDKDGNLTFSHSSLKNWADCPSHYPCDIHSIRVKETGQIITIGSKITYFYAENHPSNKKVFQLNKIEFEIAPSDKGKRILSFIHSGEPNLGKWLNINQIFNYIEPISEQKLNWGVNILSWNSFDEYPEKETYELGTACMWFDNKKARDEYIFMNKPTISRQELVEFANKKSF